LPVAEPFTAVRFLPPAAHTGNRAVPGIEPRRFRFQADIAAFVGVR
jgi:hypothetical protein